MIPLKERVSTAEERTNTNPTEGQKVGGNYQKGKVIIKGLKISIENPIGSIRSGVDREGKQWSSEMPFTYGYFNGTIGKDGDPIDVYLGPIVDEEFDVYIVDQVEEETRAFDEHKVMFGFRDIQEATEAYKSAYNEGWKGFGNITLLSLSKFKVWIKNKDAIKYPASKLSMSKKIDYKNMSEDRVKLIELSGEVKDEETLKDLQKQAGDISLFDTLVIEIASPGGSVSEGLQIMVWLDFLSQMKKQIITVVTANAYSIASLIMLAADYKIISRHGKVMVHNPMVPELSYANATELERYASELRALESTMYELYQIFTGLTQEQIKDLMDNETYLTPQEAVDNGFADVVMDIKQKSYKMAINNNKKINMCKTLNALNKVIAMVNKTDFVNQLYYDDKGGEIEIFQNDPSTYSKGDRTNKESGEFKLADGSKIKLEDFVIISIDKTIDSTEAPVVDGISVDENSTIEIPEGEIVPVTNEAEIVAPITELIIPNKGKDEMPGKIIEKTESVITTKETVALAVAEALEPGEYSLADGRKIIVSPEGLIEVVLPTQEEVITAPTAEFNVGPAPKTEEEMKAVKGEDEDEDLMALAVKEMKATIADLKSEVENLKVENKGKFENFSKFESLATEAIDALATNTVSKFQPVARALVEQPSQGSIFTRAKKDAGLS